MHTFIIAEHPEFGKIRTVEKEGRIWFCAKDVAYTLGYSNTRDAINRHCKGKGVAMYDIPTKGGRQRLSSINEGNVYRLIVGSKLPAAEKFESWIFDELVPQTLKEGSYILEKSGDMEADLLSRALLLAQGRIKERDEHITRLRQENALSAMQIRLQASKVLYYDKVLQSKSTYTTTQIAKELGMRGRELNATLRSLGIQFKQSGTWMLTARYQQEGYTVTHTHKWEDRNGEIGTAMHTVWTEKGRLFIHRLINQSFANKCCTIGVLK